MFTMGGVASPSPVQTQLKWPLGAGGVTIVLALLLGIVAGILVGLLGIGGGIVLVPAMMNVLHMDQHLAQGTSLFILLPPIGLGALRQYWKAGNVDLRAGIFCALGMLLGAYAGSKFAVPMSAQMDRKSTRLNSSHGYISYAVFCLKKKKKPLSPILPEKPQYKPDNHK